MKFDPREIPTLGDAACVTWVRGVAPDAALARLGARPPFAPLTLAAVGDAVTAAYGRDPLLRGGMPAGAVADDAGGGWTLVVEPNGFQATVAARLAALAAGTDAVSVFWNVNAVAELAVVRTGAVVAVLSDLVFWVRGEGRAPERTLADVEGDAAEVSDLVAALARVDGFRWEPAVFAWAERRVGRPVPPGWFDAAHPAAVFSVGF